MMKVFAVLTLLTLANALPKHQLVEGKQANNNAADAQAMAAAALEPSKGLLSKAADVAKKTATAAAATATINHMAEKIDGKSESSDPLNPVSTIVKSHDKKQIAQLKQTGRISEGFPDIAFVHIPQTGGDAIAMASTPIFPYGFGLRANLALNLMVDKKKQGNNFCYFEQLPPKEITKLYSKRVFEESYRKRTVFCAVRNPYDRAVAEWHNCRENGMKGPDAKCSDKCDIEDMNRFIQKELSAFQKGDYLRDECQLIPQTDYMQGEGGCTKLLNYDHLERDFNELMHSHGYNLTLKEKKETKSVSRCTQRLTAANLTTNARKMIEKVYEKDFEILGPEFGWAEESWGQKVSKFVMGPIKALTSTYAQIGEAKEMVFTDLPEPAAGHRD